jgi:hypothetical protein
MNLSLQWTATDRLALIARLADRIISAEFPDFASSCGEAIMEVATCPPETLEAHRQDILAYLAEDDPYVLSNPHQQCISSKHGHQSSHMCRLRRPR